VRRFVQPLCQVSGFGSVRFASRLHVFSQDTNSEIMWQSRESRWRNEEEGEWKMNSVRSPLTVT
jgi:hypothetical protein